jgi:hypothetical protein
MPEDQSADQCPEHTPTPWDDVKIFGEVSFSHTITRPANGILAASYLGIVVDGRVDHGIGRVLRSLPGGPKPRPKPRPKRRFHSLLLIVEAKTMLNLNQALPQLVVYLASLHQSRLRRQRSDATVYGVVSDGYAFIFVTITHDGELKQSKRFDVVDGDITTVLGCLKYLLQTSASMRPNVTPDGGQTLGGNVDSDSEMDLDDNPYVTRDEVEG